jgi:hypothetical protein
MGNTLGGYYLAKSAIIAHQHINETAQHREFFQAKLVTARFYAEHVLPHCVALAITVTEGTAMPGAMAEDGF